MKTTPELYGLVLAGGQSQRMGSDKGLLNVHGKPLREYMFGQLRSVCTNTYTSCRLEQQVPSWMNPIHDEPYTSGPLNGILSAFNFNSRCAWLTVAVDMPYVDVRILRSLVQQRDPNKLATCYLNEQTGCPEPLLTIWEPAAFPPLTGFTAGGQISPRRFLMEHSVKVIPLPVFNPVFRSLNNPDDIMELTEVCDGQLKLKNSFPDIS